MHINTRCTHLARLAGIGLMPAKGSCLEKSCVRPVSGPLDNNSVPRYICCTVVELLYSCIDFGGVTTRVVRL